MLRRGHGRKGQGDGVRKAEAEEVGITASEASA